MGISWGRSRFRDIMKCSYRFVIRSWASTPALYQPKQAGPTFPPLISSVQISCRICTSFFFPYSFVKAAKIGPEHSFILPVRYSACSTASRFSAPCLAPYQMTCCSNLPSLWSSAGLPFTSESASMYSTGLVQPFRNRSSQKAHLSLSDRQYSSDRYIRSHPTRQLESSLLKSRSTSPATRST